MYPWLNSRRYGSSLDTWPRSYSALCQNREYSRCSTACSTPPTYKSTPPGSPGRFGSLPIQYCSTPGSQNVLLLVGSRYRSSYQQEPAHCGMTFSSRLYRFGPSPRSKVTKAHSVARANGGTGSEVASSGSKDCGE